MHKSAKRIFVTIFCLILLSLALLGINFLANGFFEARFYLPEGYYKQLNTVLTIPNDYGDEPSLWRSAPGFVDEFLPGHSLSEIFTNYAIIRSSSGWVTITVYAKKNSSINDLNKLINLQYKDIASTANAAKLQKIAEALKALEQKIEALKDSLINTSSINQIIERQATDKYIEAFIAAAQSQETLRYIQTKGASLDLPIIAHDPEIKRLTSLKHCAEVRLMQLDAAGRGTCSQAKIVGQQKIALEQKVKARSAAILTGLKSQAQLDRALEQHLQKFLGQKAKSSSSNIVSFKQLEDLLQQKLQLSLEQQSLKNEADVNNMIIVKVHPQIPYIWLLLFLSMVLLILSALPFLYKKFDKKMLHSRKSDNIDLSELAQLIAGKPHGAVAFFAQQAEAAAAKFIMYLRKVIGLKLRIVLLDFSGKIINKYTDNTKTIKDVLAEDIDLSQIIYHDSTIDIDIIMANGIGELDTIEKRQRFRHIMVNCYQNYDLIIYSVSEEVEVPINSFLPKDATIVVVCSAFDAFDAKNWAKVLRSVGFRLIHFLKLA